MSQNSTQADIEFIQGEFGDVYVIVVKNADGTLADLSPFIGGTNTLLITDDNYSSPPLVSASVGINALLSQALWTMTSGQTANLSGSYSAMLVFVNGGSSVTRRTKPMSVQVYPAVPAS